MSKKGHKRKRGQDQLKLVREKTADGKVAGVMTEAEALVVLAVQRQTEVPSLADSLEELRRVRPRFIRRER
jgi:hypothetical protein